MPYIMLCNSSRRLFPYYSSVLELFVMKITSTFTDEKVTFKNQMYTCKQSLLSRVVKSGHGRELCQRCDIRAEKVT